MTTRKLRKAEPPARPRQGAQLFQSCAHCGGSLARAWGRWALRHYRRVDDYLEWCPADDRDCCSLACLQAALRALARTQGDPDD